MDPTKQYDSTFTPEGEEELDKECGSCFRVLRAGKFKMKKGNRHGIRGIIRNRCCRECETPSRDTAIIGSTINNIDEDRIVCIEGDIVKLQNIIEAQQKSINDLQTIIGSVMAKLIKIESQVAFI